MKLSPAAQEQLVQLLTRLYFDICRIEGEYQLVVGEGDFRPRIEYFHDAVRALTTHQETRHEAPPRLGVEWLAYDLGCLRYIHARPLAPFSPHPHASPHTDLVAVKPDSLSVPPKRPGRSVREELAQLYQRYAVLFAALFKPFADDDFHARADSAHQDTETLHALVAQFEKAASQSAIATTVQHIDDDALRAALLNFLESGKHKSKANVKTLLAKLKGEIKQKKKDVDTLEKAHMDYGRAQLALYEDAKDIVKKMAGSGMNLVGAFVESAMAETRREMGR